MTAQGSRAQIEGLKELWVTENSLSYLETLDDSTLAQLHAEVEAHVARVHEGHRRVYEVMAKATRFIPNFMLAKLSNGLTPYIMARICEHLDPKSATALSKNYDAATLAEIALHLDTQLVAAIAKLQDLDTLLSVTEALIKKGLYRRLAEVSDALDDNILQKMVERIRDPERIAAVASHMQSMSKLTSLSQRIPKKLNEAVLQVLHRQGHVLAAQALGA